MVCTYTVFPLKLDVKYKDLVVRTLWMYKMCKIYACKLGINIMNSIILRANANLFFKYFFCKYLMCHTVKNLHAEHGG